MPTGGVDATEASVGEWIRAGAAAVGMGSKLIAKEVVARREFDRIAETTAQVLRWIGTAREGG
jgi:2-dehydro-3-deoxyphosphogluconate aldolase/(4S)-4-hydroxy-2-oxoglutarate aldolase